MRAPVSRITPDKNSLVGGFPSFHPATCLEGVRCVLGDHMPQNSQGPWGDRGPVSRPLLEALPSGGDYSSPGPRGKRQTQSRRVKGEGEDGRAGLEHGGRG